MHIPVLLKEVLELANPQPGEFFIDGTFGSGGHAKEILKRVGKEGKLLAVDWNEDFEEKLDSRLRGNDKEGGNDKKQVIKIEGNYADLAEILEKKGLEKADGLVLDLGFSSEQLEAGRGFNFSKREEPLLMTYNDEMEPVKEVLKKITVKELEKIIRDYSGERYAGRIAKAIKAKRIETNKDLAEAIREAVPKGYEKGRIDAATRTFQALRIYANKELENLEKVLKDLPRILKSGGRAVIISFHSLEDGLVKKYFKNLAKEGRAEILTPKPVKARAQEVADNPRSRSALLRSIKIN